MSGAPRTRNKKGERKRVYAAPRPGSSIDLAEKLHEAGAPMPLAVMIDNMSFWWSKAQRLEDELKGIHMLASEMGEKDKAKALKKIESFLEARDKAQDCAVDAAPYMHAKLASITVMPDENPAGKEIAKTIIQMRLPKPLQEDEDRSYRDAPPKPTVVVKKQDAS